MSEEKPDPYVWQLVDWDNSHMDDSSGRGGQYHVGTFEDENMVRYVAIRFGSDDDNEKCFTCLFDEGRLRDFFADAFMSAKSL